jgi:hypothetical protein
MNNFMIVDVQDIGISSNVNPFAAIGTAYAVPVIFSVFAIWTALAVSIIIKVIIIN